MKRWRTSRSVALCGLVAGLVGTAQTEVAAQEPEPLRVVVHFGSSVAPNLADAVAADVAVRIAELAGVEVLDWPSVFERAMAARGLATDARNRPSCITALQLAPSEGVDAVVCGEVGRGRDGLEVSGRLYADGVETRIDVAGFEEQQQAVEHVVAAFRRWMEGRTRPLGLPSR